MCRQCVNNRVRFPIRLFLACVCEKPTEKKNVSFGGLRHRSCRPVPPPPSRPGTLARPARILGQKKEPKRGHGRPRVFFSEENFLGSAAVREHEGAGLTRSMPATRHVIVYGGAGALGAAAVEAFKREQWTNPRLLAPPLLSLTRKPGSQTTTSVDVRASTSAANSVIVDGSAPFLEQAKKVVEEVKVAVDKWGKADAIICVAGGWAGGNAASAGAGFLPHSGTPTTAAEWGQTQHVHYAPSRRLPQEQ
ncbi:MAG: hypothetical protein BJ554DRAFT_1832 [Olpidium bornovanus]|uniref:Quinoid dihydropteridine reductase n=1 Tax=Olpidium bornovanus TaxID=278681 RepID=A0A8H7ZRR8_9FUNG|nr:MAG: hypothetical protein BJ554DRAFT_1832 [Olpidium bornovanus]